VDQALEDFGRTWAAAEEERPLRRRAGKSFTSLDAARKVLTPKRLQLLRAIRRAQPESLTRLARLLGRDLRHVQEDVETLLAHGLVALKKTRAISGREVSAPTVPFQELELRIPIGPSQEPPRGTGGPV
jgi:predicted transcriptional regulator